MATRTFKNGDQEFTAEVPDGLNDQQTQQYIFNNWDKVVRPVAIEETPMEVEAPDPQGVGAAAWGGLQRGVAAVPGILGDLENLGNAGYAWLTGQERDPSQDRLYDSGETIAIYEDLVGKTYRPQTTAEEYASTLGEFVGGAAATGGAAGLVSGGVRGAVSAAGRQAVAGGGSALVSETAGQAARQLAPEYEGVARLAGAVAPLAISQGRVSAKPEINTARAAAADRLRQRGIRVSAGQATGDKKTLMLESTLDASPGSGQAFRRQYYDPQDLQFSQAALETAGFPQGVTHATDDVLSARYGQLQNEYGRIANSGQLNMTRVQPLNVAAVRRFAAENIKDENLRTKLVNMTEDLANDAVRARNNNAGSVQFRDGNTYLEWRRAVNKGLNKTDGSANSRRTLEFMRDQLDSAFEDLRPPNQRGNGTLVDELRELDANYARYKVIEGAVGSTGEAASSGLVTPTALGREAAKGRKGAYVRAEGDFDQLARDGQSIITQSKTSNTAERTAYMQMLNSPARLLQSQVGQTGAMAQTGGVLMGGLDPMTLGATGAAAAVGYGVPRATSMYRANPYVNQLYSMGIENPILGTMGGRTPYTTGAALLPGYSASVDRGQQ